MAHCSWRGSEFNFSELLKFQENCRKNPSKIASEYQKGLVPVYDTNKINLEKEETQLELYKTFFEKSGCLIIKNVYTKQLMDKYNRWCEQTLESAKVIEKNLDVKFFLISNGRMKSNV